MLKASTAAVGFLGVVLLLSLGPPIRGADKPAGFRVIVQASNPAASLSVSDVAQFFMKRTTRWGGGGAVQPVDLPPTSAIRDQFSRSVLGRSAVAVEAYWTKQIFSGQGTPPIVKGSERDVMAYVKENAGAIGYVAADTPLDTGVKAVNLTGK